MATDPKIQIEEALRAALRQEAPQHADMPIVLERPKQADHGDFSSNLALQLAKPLRKKPRELADKLARLISLEGSIEQAVVAGPGFITFRLKASALSDSRACAMARIFRTVKPKTVEVSEACRISRRIGFDATASDASVSSACPTLTTCAPVSV